MPDALPLSEPNRGRLSEGPTLRLVDRTVEFVRAELAGWRDDADRNPEEAEERLNAQLCKYLNVAASNRFPMVQFHHEEKQTGTRRIDISVLPKKRGFVGRTYHTIYDPFLVFEGKRLPAPSTDRKREYVTGGRKKSGGIQRFKLALHGAQQTTAAMIGYIQRDDPVDWLKRINDWILDEVTNKSISGENWSLDEQLVDFVEDPAIRVARASSMHQRTKSAVSPEIQLCHLWVTVP